MPNDIIIVKNLVKDYEKLKAVNDVTFSVSEGEIFGFLGPNGAGKSTVINIIATMLAKNNGQVTVAGYDVYHNQDEVRKLLGIVFQEEILDKNLTASQNLKIHGRLYNIPEKEIKNRIDEVLTLVELQDVKHKTVRALSGGMKRRLEIARSIMHNPKILILDEPTVGLDPQSRKKIWDYLSIINKDKKMTIFLTTHYMDEAEICDHVAIITKGKIIANDTPEKLKKALANNKVSFQTKDIVKCRDYLHEKYLYEINEADQKITININDNVSKFVVDFIRNTSIDLDNLEIKYPTLNDVFLTLTSEDLYESN